MRHALRPFLLFVPVLLALIGCASPVVVRVEWREGAENPSVRHVEFEDYRLVRTGDSFWVSLSHEEGWMPWPFIQHYRGEDLSFTFPAPEGGRTVAVTEGNYLVDSQVFLKTAFREGRVEPAPEDAEALGDFRVVFDAERVGGDRAEVTLSGRLPE